MRWPSMEWKLLYQEMLGCLESDFMKIMKERRASTESTSSLGEIDAAALYALTRISKPQLILESGSFRGMSTAFLRKAQVDSGIKDGRVVTVDPRADAQLGLLIPEDLRGGVTQEIGGIKQILVSGRLPNRVDLFFHDSIHRYRHQLWEFETFWPRLNPGGLLVSHDVDKNASFVNFVSRTYAHNLEGYTDVHKTSHALWGTIRKIGFIFKSIPEPEDPRSNQNGRETL